MTSKNLDHFYLWTETITPFDETGVVDKVSLGNLLRIQEKFKNAIVLWSDNSEHFHLLDKQNDEILDFALSLNLKVPLVVEMNSMGISDAKMKLKNLEAEEKIDAYILSFPEHILSYGHGQLKWFETLLNLSSKPCLLACQSDFNSKVILNSEILIELSEHPHFWGLKDQSASHSLLKRFHECFPTKKIFCANEAWAPLYFSLGSSCGLISKTSNILPQEMAFIVEKCRQGAFEETELWKEYADALSMVDPILAIKEVLLEERKILSSYVVAPLSFKDFKSKNTVSNANKSLREWFLENTLIKKQMKINN